FGSGDGLNTAGYQWVRGRYGSTSNANAAVGVAGDVNRKQVTIKIDEYLTSKHKIAANWSIQRDKSADFVVNWPGSLSGITRRTPQTLTITGTSTLSPTLLNEFRFGMRREVTAEIPAFDSPDATTRDAAKKYLLQGGTNAALGSLSPQAAGKTGAYPSVVSFATLNVNGVPGQNY